MSYETGPYDGAAAESADSSQKYVTELQPDDVLFGRGSGPNDHAGNVRFRQLVSERKTAYMSTSHRVTKAKIAREIVDLVQGRFLKKLDCAPEGFDANDDVYEVVDDHTVMEKAKQALRQNATKTREEVAAAKLQKQQQQRPAAAGVANPYTHQSLSISKCPQEAQVQQAALYDFEPIPLKSESSLPMHPPPPAAAATTWDSAAVVPEMQVSSEVLPIPPPPQPLEEGPYYGGGEGVAATGPSQQQQQQQQTYQEQQQQAYLQQHHQEHHLPSSRTTVQQGQQHLPQHRQTASAPPHAMLHQQHHAEQSMAEIPSEDAFEGRRSSMNMSDLFKARNEHRRQYGGGGGNGSSGGTHNNSSLQVHQLRRPSSPIMMDELMDSFSQMRATGTTGGGGGAGGAGSTSISMIPDHERSRMMASTETMGTIEHLGSVADMSIGTMGSSTFSLFGNTGRGNEGSLAFDTVGAGNSGGAAPVTNPSNTATTTPGTSHPPSTSTSSTRSSKLSHQSDVSLSIHDVYYGDAAAGGGSGGVGVDRRKSSSLTSSSTLNGMAMTSSSTINGKITEVMRQVEAEAAAAGTLPRTIGIEGEDSLVMGDSSLALLKSALKEGDDEGDDEDEAAAGDGGMPHPSTAYTQANTSTTLQQQQPYYKNY